MSGALASARFVGLFPLVYLVHLVDERYFWIGTAEFATHYLGVYFTNTAWWYVNVPSMLAFALAAALVARGRWPQWVVVAFAVHFLLHGLGRVPTSLWTLTLAPGVVTGVLLCTPLGVAALLRGARELPRRRLRIGVLAGLASFQPFWHFALLPMLPEGPTSAGP